MSTYLPQPRQNTPRPTDDSSNTNLSQLLKNIADPSKTYNNPIDDAHDYSRQLNAIIRMANMAKIVKMINDNNKQNCATIIQKTYMTQEAKQKMKQYLEFKLKSVPAVKKTYSDSVKESCLGKLNTEPLKFSKTQVCKDQRMSPDVESQLMATYRLIKEEFKEKKASYDKLQRENRQFIKKEEECLKQINELLRTIQQKEELIKKLQKECHDYKEENSQLKAKDKEWCVGLSSLYKEANKQKERVQQQQQSDLPVMKYKLVDNSEVSYKEQQTSSVPNFLKHANLSVIEVHNSSKHEQSFSLYNLEVSQLKQQNKQLKKQNEQKELLLKQLASKLAEKERQIVQLNEGNKLMDDNYNELVQEHQQLGLECKRLMEQLRQINECQRCKDVELGFDRAVMSILEIKRGYQGRVQ